MLSKLRLVFRRTSIMAVCAALLMLTTACVNYHIKPSDDANISTDGSQLQIHIIDVGNADAILAINGDNSLLIDAGENGDGDDVVNYLRSQGVQTLDYAIATHPDADHIGGMDVVINEIPIDTFIMSIMPERITPTTKTYLDLLEALDNSDVNVTEAEPGSSYLLGSSMINILGPVGEFGSTNNMSVVCRIDFGAHRFLFMGDAENQAEDALMAAGADLKADFIKIGHHGSHSSSQKKFLKKVSPQYAVIPCGANNRYGHPHPETLKLLKKMNITYYRSDLDGTITFVSDGNEIETQTRKRR